MTDEEKQKIIDDSEKINEMMKDIKVYCPVYKLNLSLETKQAFASIYIMIIEDRNEADKVLSEVADKNDVNNDTILIFNQRHIIELSNMLYGILSLYKEQKKITDTGILSFIREYIDFVDDMHTYEEYMVKIREMMDRYFPNGSNISIDLLERTYIVLRDMIFIPYAKIDDLAETFVKIYKEEYTNDNN